VRLALAGSLPSSVGARGSRGFWGLSFGVVAVAAALIATRVGAPSLALALGLAAGIGATAWMFFSERVEGPLVVFLLYLGLLDGFLKLRTNSSVITLGRDVLLYVIVLGLLARAALRRERLRFPPLSGWVLAFTVLVLLQVFNPASRGLLHTLGALRPHLEFVPLFFIGYALLRTKARLRTFLVILLLIATANGVAGIVQLNLTPQQFARWGPGYATRINGGNGITGRVYYTDAGVARTRPFGLGDDAGVGATWGMLALGGALALVSLGTRLRIGRLSLLLCAGPPLAVISGEERSLLVASAALLVAFVAFATTAKRLIPTMTAVILGLVAIVGVVAYIGSVSGAGVFERYLTITPGRLASALNENRGISLAAIPKLASQDPLGNGLGSSGPASGFAGGGNAGSNSETEPGFLISELGVPGLLVVYGFMLHLLFLGVTRIRRLDSETRILVAALLAGLAGLLILGISSSTTATPPGSAFLWLAGGALSYWLVTAVRSETQTHRDSAAGPALPAT
jgi:hypothetical protein